MSELDYKYIAKLVVKAQIGDNDAFAEIYAATYQRQYSFSFRYLRNADLAQDALQETYILALKNLSKLKDPMLLLAWLNQINFRVCYKLHTKEKLLQEELSAYDALKDNTSDSKVSSPEDIIVQIDSKQYIINQVLNLPFTESQVIILRYYQNLKLDEIAKLLDISRSSVKRYLAKGKTHLEKILREGGTSHEA